MIDALLLLLIRVTFYQLSPDALRLKLFQVV